jgi:hypothetical protein
MRLQVDTLVLKLVWGILFILAWSSYFGLFYNFHTNMVLVLVPRLNFFSSMLWGRQTPGIEIGMMQGIYLILQWVPTRMVSVSPGPSTSLVGSLYQCWYLGQFYISVQHWIVPIFKRKSSFPKASPQWEQELHISIHVTETLVGYIIYVKLETVVKGNLHL